MKTVKIIYQCDYCKQVIDMKEDAVCTLHPGRIDSDDKEVPDPEDGVQHYHDYCMEYLLCLTAATDPRKKEEPEPDTEKSGKDTSDQGHAEESRPGPKSRKDLGKLNSLLNAGWGIKKIADEFGVTDKTIRNWMQELKKEEKE